MSNTVTRTVSLTVRNLDAGAIIEFADLLQNQQVPREVPVNVKQHEGQRGENQGATLEAIEVTTR